MTISGRVVRASRGTRGLVAAGLVAVWTTCFVLTLQLAVAGSISWTLWGIPVGLVLAALMGSVVWASDASSRRRQAQRAGWRGDPDLLAVVQVDADQGVLPTTEPEREVAYRYAVRVWRQRWSLRVGAVVLVVVELLVVLAAVALGGWRGAVATSAYLVVGWFVVHRAAVVLPRLHRIIRTVEGR